MKKLLIGLLIFVIVVFGGFYLYVKMNQKPLNQKPAAPDHFAMAYDDVTFTIGDPYGFFDGECDAINENDLSVVPIIVDGRTAIPLELMDAAFNVTSTYDNSSGTINVTNDTTGFQATLTINNSNASINSQAITTQDFPFVQENIVYLPLKFLLDHSDCNQPTYDDATKQITLTPNNSTSTQDELDAMQAYKKDTFNAYTLAKAAAKLCTTNQTFMQMTDFSRRVVIDFNYIQPYVADTGIDFSTINTGQAPWVISVNEGDYQVTDSNIEAKVYFNGPIEFPAPSSTPSALPDIAPNPDETIMPTYETIVPTLDPTAPTPTPAASLPPTVPPVQ